MFSLNFCSNELIKSLFIQLFLEIERMSEANLRSFLKRKRVIVFAGTFFLYGAYHSARGAWGNLKIDLADEEQQGFTENQIAIMDFCFMLCYSISLTILGHLLDHFCVKKIVTIGISGLVLCFLVFSLMGLFKCKVPWMFMAIQGFNGVFQGTVTLFHGYHFISSFL